MIANAPTLMTDDLTGLRVSEDEYLSVYAEQRYEWVEGKLLKKMSGTSEHFNLTLYLAMVVKAYFAFNPIGILSGEPVTMRTPNIPNYREPDLMIILNDNAGDFTSKGMFGAADVCIEVVSPGSVAVDYVDKLAEYEASGVREYWLLDYERSLALFHRLNANGRYERQFVDADDCYRTPLLPKFALHVPTLWQTPFPNYFEVGAMVKQMWETPDA